MLAKTASPGLKRVTRLPASTTTPARSLAQRGRQIKLEDGLERPFRNHVVDRVQTRGVNLDQNLVRRGRRPRDVGQRDLIRLAVTLEGKSSHFSSRSEGSRSGGGGGRACAGCARSEGLRGARGLRCRRRTPQVLGNPGVHQAGWRKSAQKSQAPRGYRPRSGAAGAPRRRLQHGLATATAARQWPSPFTFSGHARAPRDTHRAWHRAPFRPRSNGVLRTQVDRLVSLMPPSCAVHGRCLTPE